MSCSGVSFYYPDKIDTLWEYFKIYFEVSACHPNCHITCVNCAVYRYRSIDTFLIFFACLKAYDYGIPIFEGDIGNLRPLKNIIWKWLYYLDFTLFHVTMVMFEWNSFIFYWLLSNWWQPYAYMYRGFITIWFRQRNSNNRWRLILCLDDKFFKKV